MIEGAAYLFPLKFWSLELTRLSSIMFEGAE